MVRSFVLVFLALTLVVASYGCAKSGATKEEKAAALAAAMELAKNDPDVSPSIISLKEAHGKMIVIIKPGVHPQKQSAYIQAVGLKWFNTYPEGKKPTKNDMIQVWLYETDESKDDLGMIQMWADQYGKMNQNFHHYKTQPVM